MRELQLVAGSYARWLEKGTQHASLPVGVRKATLAAFQVVWWVEPVVQGQVALAATVTEGGDLMEPACRSRSTCGGLVPMPDIRAMPVCLSSSTKQSHLNSQQNVSHAAA